MKHHTGIIEVVCGSMFSGKTDELIRRLRRATIARQKVQVFKPGVDTRYAIQKVTSHAGSEFDALPIESSAQLMENLQPDTTVVGIDEAQFFDEGIVAVADQLASKGIRVIVAGLDTDFRAEPFGCMPIFMAKAERVDKLHGVWGACQPDPAIGGRPAGPLP